MDYELHKSWQQEAFCCRPCLPWMTGNICLPASRLVAPACLQAVEVPNPVPPLPGALGLLSATISEGSLAHCWISCSLQWESTLSGHSPTCGNLDFSPEDWRALRTAHTILFRDCSMQTTFAHTSSIVLGPQSIQSYPSLLLILFWPNTSAFIQIRMKVKESPLSPSLTEDYGTSLGDVGLNLLLPPSFQLSKWML